MAFAQELIGLLNTEFGPTTDVEAGLPDILYHYRSAEGAIGILCEQRVRFTDIRYLNDASEIKHGAEVATSVLSELEQRESNSVVKEFLSRSQTTITPDIVDWYVFCLCEQPNLLSQRRGYGGVLTPYCLGLASSEFAAIDSGSES